MEATYVPESHTMSTQLTESLSTLIHAVESQRIPHIPFAQEITLAFRFTRVDGSLVECIPQKIRDEFCAVYTSYTQFAHIFTFVDEITFTSAKCTKDRIYITLHVSGNIEHWLDAHEWHTNDLVTWRQNKDHDSEYTVYYSENGFAYTYSIVASEITDML